MPYVYSKVSSLDGTTKVGSFQCVVLVQHYAKAPMTAMWRRGAMVKGHHGLTDGTAIATFVDGRYPNLAHGNHAALYLSQTALGIYVMDQWTDSVKKPKVSKRFIRFLGINKSGDFVHGPSDNGDAFYVIEAHP
jgi:hypothetical protein